jgi:hypothetical protein
MAPLHICCKSPVMVPTFGASTVRTVLPFNNLISSYAFSRHKRLFGQKARAAPCAKIYRNRATAAIVNDNSITGFMLFDQSIGTFVY